MARQPKEGLDYFLLDCVLDDKFRLIEAEFGLSGFGVVVKLFQKIYGQCGYYVEWKNEVALLFAKDIGLGGSVVSEIVSASVKRGIFDVNMYERYSILTSAGIQKRYLEAVKRRNAVVLKRPYLLVSVDIILENVDINVIYADINPENVCRSTQSRVEKRRVKKSREENISPKVPFGEFGCVFMLEEEYQKLVEKFQLEMVEEKIADLDRRIRSGERKYMSYKDHYATLGGWCRKDSKPASSANPFMREDL